MKKVFFAVCVFTVMVSNMNLMAQEWYEKIKFKGDFRNRFEYIEDETVLDSNGDEVKRYRERIRFRIGATADIGKDLKVGFRIASGESADPVSTNQSLTTGFSKKGITLDLAYADYKASESSPMSGFQAVVGKMDNPFYKPGGSDLIWDNDITPEGLYVSYSKEIGEKFELKGLLGGFWIQERSAAADSGMLAFEIIGNFKPTENLSLGLGLSYFNYGNAQNNGPFFDSTKGFGNTLNGTAYDADFDLFNIGFEIGYKFEFAPIKFFIDFVNNSGAETDLDTGFLVGFSLGKISGAKSWMVSISYRELEADAAVGAFTDSDISGGGTDIDGIKFAAEYAIYKNWIVGMTVMVGDKKIETSSDGYTRVQLDMNFKF